MNDQGTATFAADAGYGELAADFIAEAERYAALGLPVLPDDPAEAAAMRADGYDVLAECTGLAGTSAIVSVAGEDEDLGHSVAAGDLAAALGVPALAMLPGTEFLAVLRETPAAGRALSGFRPLPGAGMTAARKTA